jgi:hypothetical protein
MRRPHWRIHWAAFANEAVEEREAAFKESPRTVLVAEFVLEQPKLVATDVALYLNRGLRSQGVHDLNTVIYCS